MHTPIDQGVNFCKLAKHITIQKLGKITFGALWLHSGPLCDARRRAGSARRPLLASIYRKSKICTRHISEVRDSAI